MIRLVYPRCVIKANILPLLTNNTTNIHHGMSFPKFFCIEKKDLFRRRLKLKSWTWSLKTKPTMESNTTSLPSRLSQRIIVLRSSHCSSYADVVPWLLRSRRSSPPEDSWLAHFRNFCIIPSIHSCYTEVSKIVIDLEKKSVEVWSTLPYGDILAVIEQTGKEVCFLFILSSWCQ
jgi:hypothetical protein